MLISVADVYLYEVVHFFISHFAHNDLIIVSTCNMFLISNYNVQGMYRTSII